MPPDYQGDQYGGPPMLTDHDFIVGSYHLLTSLTTKVGSHDAKIEIMQKTIGELRDDVLFHRRIFTWVGISIIPILLFVGNYLLNHHP